MRKVAVYSAFLLLGLVASQLGPAVAPTTYALLAPWVRVATMICLGFIMIRVGYEFDIDKRNIRHYAVDYGVAATAAAFPWLLCALYFIFVMSPASAWHSYHAWVEALLVARFSAPTSAGILFAMLAAAGLASTWVFRKARILAIFDDLDTVLLMIPLKIMMIGFQWSLGALGVTVLLLLWLAWRYLHVLRWPTGWRATVGYAVAVALVCELIYLGTKWANPAAPLHLEVLLPAFVLGCMIRHEEKPDSPSRTEDGAVTLITGLFLIFVGMSMPRITTEGEALIGGAWPGWGWVAAHVLVITLLSNAGKMFSLLCYAKEASWRERLAVSIAMFPRGEVGAGVLVVSMSYGIGGPVLTVAMLSLALNLMMTGLFIAAVKRLIR